MKTKETYMLWGIQTQTMTPSTPHIYVLIIKEIVKKKIKLNSSF